MKSVSIILLAAGSSSRLGQSKQLLQMQGMSLLRHSVEEALKSKAEQVIVVLGSQADLHAKEIHGLNIQIHVNKTWVKGMGNSLRSGIAFMLEKFSTTEAAIVMVCDQPRISGAHLDNMIAKFEESGKNIVASFYEGAPGVPALFSKSCFDELKQIPDGGGARGVIENHKDELLTIPFLGGEIDIDTPKDLSEL